MKTIYKNNAAGIISEINGVLTDHQFGEIISIDSTSYKVQRKEKITKVSEGVEIVNTITYFLREN